MMSNHPSMAEYPPLPTKVLRALAALHTLAPEATPEDVAETVDLFLDKWNDVADSLTDKQFPYVHQGVANALIRLPEEQAKLTLLKAQVAGAMPDGQQLRALLDGAHRKVKEREARAMLEAAGEQPDADAEVSVDG